MLFTLYGTGLQITGNNVMPFFMEKHGDSKVEHLNYYPTGMTATGILAFWVYSILSDKLKTRVPASIAIGCTFIFGAALLYSDSIPYGGKLTAFCKFPHDPKRMNSNSDHGCRSSGHLLVSPGTVVFLGQCKLCWPSWSCFPLLP